MKTIHIFFMGLGLMLMAGPNAWAQGTSKVRVDPGVSVHNYKHPNKARQAGKSQFVKIRRSASRVGIVPRSRNHHAPRVQYQAPKYAQRSGWTFFMKSNPRPTVLNPLTNPNNYKVDQGR